MGDEGVGVHLVKYLENKHLPKNVEVLDGGTGSFYLLEYFHRYRRIILVDATIDGEPAGTLNMLKPKYSSDYPTTLTAHDIGLKDLLDALYLTERRPEIILFTISIAGLNSVTLDLSPEIRQAIPGAADQIIHYIEQGQK